MTTMATMVATTAIGLLSRAILSRVVGPEGAGIYSLVVLVPPLAFVFGGLGVTTSTVFLAGSQKYAIDRLAGTVLTSSLLLSLLSVGILCFWSALSYESLFPHIPPPYAALAIITVPFLFLLNNFQSLLQGRNLVGQYNWVILTSGIVTLLLLVVFLLVVGMGVTGAIFAWFLGTVFNAVHSGVKVSHFTRIPLRFSTPIFRHQLMFGLNAYFANLAGFLVRRVDVLLVANMLGTVQLGYYSIAYTLAELLWYLASSACIALLPFIAGTNRSDSQNVTTAVVRITLWSTAAMCLVVPFFDRLAIRLVVGEAFLPAVVPLRWLLPGILFGALEKVLAGDLVGRGRPDVTMISAVLALAVNLGVNFTILPSVGIVGASIASSLAYAAAALLTVHRFLKITGTTWKSVSMLRHSDITYVVQLLRSASGRIGTWPRR